MAKKNLDICYPLLLLLVCPAFMLAQNDDACSEVEERCRGGNGYILSLAEDNTCTIGGRCVTQSYRRRKMVVGAELMPKMEFCCNLPVKVGTFFSVTCRAWAQADKQLESVVIEVSAGSGHPTVSSRERVVYTRGGTERVAIVTLEMSLTADRHGQNITCRMNFGPDSNATDSEKDRAATEMFYAYEQTNPKIVGPTTTDLGQEYSWECLTETVTLDETDQFTVYVHVFPYAGGVVVEKSVFTSLDSNANPHRYMVTRKLKVRVPLSLMPSFFVKCSATNYVLSASNPANLQTDQRVIVQDKPNDISLTFNLIGAGFGLAGLLFGAGLVTYYRHKKRIMTQAAMDEALVAQQEREQLDALEAELKAELEAEKQAEALRAAGLEPPAEFAVWMGDDQVSNQASQQQGHKQGQETFKATSQLKLGQNSELPSESSASNIPSESSASNIPSESSASNIPNEISAPPSPNELKDTKKQKEK